MENHNAVISKFYTAFRDHDAKAMSECYHPEIEFSDPVFVKLRGKDASKMWIMLIERSKGKLHINFSDVQSDENLGSAKWIATYLFSKTNRNVINNVKAKFEFKDGLIIKHTDDFDLWKWSRMAFGFKGLLLGWTNLMQNKIRETAKNSLSQFRGS